MTDCHSSNVARNRSFEIQVEDTVDDERPPRGRDRPSAVVRLSGGSRGPVIQENLDRPVTVGHLETVLNDFQARMSAVMEEQIKSNMLFFQVDPEKHPEAKKIEETIQPKKNLPKKAETWEVTSMPTSSKRSKITEPATSAEPIEFSKDQYSILMEIKDQYELKTPTEMKMAYRNRDKSKYFHFHKDCGQETIECKHLKRALEDLARKAGGPTNRGHKNYLWELSQVMLTNQAESNPFLKIVVSELDRGKIRTPHDDPLVVEMKIKNLRVRQILIDTGSSTDIISADCLSRLKFDENNLVPVNHPIIGFGGGIIHPMGTVTLPVRVGDKEASRTLFVKFLVVRDSTVYNVILGRPTFNHVKAVIVTHLMLMKFECDGGKIGSLSGDQQAARECYLTTLKPSSWRGEKSEWPKAIEEELVEILKGQISGLKNEVGKSQLKAPQESKPSILLPSKKRKCLAIKELRASFL
ncbi:hypothetical protein BVRB_5g126340 [Beta vulgaris subsp. vulgaris]|uniref:Peptidase A2 domain-containing protein n=1 Tax=Beta vulgaris subsp. vulgaris TaxID=3555 RepID=A0A0J8B9A4_BETVV|nr:hypothetical protein BVRB_5g126340 [Beta vulgaris subsp. vulgaris]